jgi:hypothetical protein
LWICNLRELPVGPHTSLLVPSIFGQEILQSNLISAPCLAAEEILLYNCMGLFRECGDESLVGVSKLRLEITEPRQQSAVLAPSRPRWRTFGLPHLVDLLQALEEARITSERSHHQSRTSSLYPQLRCIFPEIAMNFAKLLNASRFICNF